MHGNTSFFGHFQFSLFGCCLSFEEFQSFKKCNAFCNLSWWLQKEMSPPVVKASRRLLINAVREVVNESALFATKKDALRRTESAKRLQSVVSSDAGKTLITN